MVLSQIIRLPRLELIPLVKVTVLILRTLSRITITVKASYINLKDPTFDFDRNFSFFKDFDNSSHDLSSEEEGYVEEIFDQIILDIFNASVANW